MIEYFVNEEKRTVVAKITDYVVGDEYVTVTGKSKCHPDDEWDVKKGTKLARIRAIKKFNASKMRMLNDMIKWHTKSLDSLNREYQKLSDANYQLEMIEMEMEF